LTKVETIRLSSIRNLPSPTTSVVKMTMICWISLITWKANTLLTREKARNQKQLMKITRKKMLKKAKSIISNMMVL